MADTGVCGGRLFGTPWCLSCHDGQEDQGHQQPPERRDRFHPREEKSRQEDKKECECHRHHGAGEAHQLTWAGRGHGRQGRCVDLSGVVTDRAVKSNRPLQRTCAQRRPGRHPGAFGEPPAFAGRVGGGGGGEDRGAARGPRADRADCGSSGAETRCAASAWKTSVSAVRQAAGPTRRRRVDARRSFDSTRRTCCVGNLVRRGARVGRAARPRSDVAAPLGGCH